MNTEEKSHEYMEERRARFAISIDYADVQTAFIDGADSWNGVLIEQRRILKSQSLELQSLKQQLSRIMQVAGERAERIKELEDIIYTPPHV